MNFHYQFLQNVTVICILKTTSKSKIGVAKKKYSYFKKADIAIYFKHKLSFHILIINRFIKLFRI